LNISYLRYAVEVEKTRSITQAAENLYMGQPNLSKAIKELEAGLGITIFKRTSKGVAPTQKGEEFLGYARTILSQIDEMESLYNPLKPSRISFNISVPRASYITYAFTKFVETLDPLKEMDIDFKETNSMEAIESVVEREFNMAIIRYQNNFEKYFLNLLSDKNVQHHILWEFEYLALMSKDHPLAQCDRVIYHDLSKYIEIIHGDLAVPSLSYNEIMKSISPKYPKKRVKVYERGSQFDLLNRVPSTYMWVSPLPREVLDHYGLVQRKCSDMNQKYKDVIIYLKDYRLKKLDKAFIAILTAVKDELKAIEYV